MSHVLYHARSSAARFGGAPDDYIALHSWFDATKMAWCDSRHRALRHHDFGLRLAIGVFGDHISTADGGVETQAVCHQHLKEDCGRMPTVADWLASLPEPSWCRGTSAADDMTLFGKPASDDVKQLIAYFAHPDDELADLPDHARLALRCHAFGVFEAETHFGPWMDLGADRQMPTRVYAERIVAALCGHRVPSVSDWLSPIRKRCWMNVGYTAAVVAA